MTVEEIRAAALSKDPAVQGEASARLYEELAHRLASTPMDAWNLNGIDATGIIAALLQAAQWHRASAPAAARHLTADERERMKKAFWNSVEVVPEAAAAASEPVAWIDAAGLRALKRKHSAVVLPSRFDDEWATPIYLTPPATTPASAEGPQTTARVTKDVGAGAPTQDETMIQFARLRAAARDVCSFDWSDNDDDAVATIYRLRGLLGEPR